MNIQRRGVSDKKAIFKIRGRMLDGLQWSAVPRAVRLIPKVSKRQKRADCEDNGPGAMRRALQSACWRDNLFCSSSKSREVHNNSALSDRIIMVTNDCSCSTGSISSLSSHGGSAIRRGCDAEKNKTIIVPQKSPTKKSTTVYGGKLEHRAKSFPPATPITGKTTTTSSQKRELRRLCQLHQEQNNAVVLRKEQKTRDDLPLSAKTPPAGRKEPMETQRKFPVEVIATTEARPIIDEFSLPSGIDTASPSCDENQDRIPSELISLGDSALSMCSSVTMCDEMETPRDVTMLKKEIARWRSLDEAIDGSFNKHEAPSLATLSSSSSYLAPPHKSASRRRRRRRRRHRRSAFQRHNSTVFLEGVDLTGDAVKVEKERIYI